MDTLLSLPSDKMLNLMDIEIVCYKGIWSLDYDLKLRKNNVLLSQTVINRPLK